MAVSRSLYDGIAMRCVLSVLWIAGRLVTPGDAVQVVHIVRIHMSGGQRTKPPEAESLSHLHT